MENSTERRQFSRYHRDLRALINHNETWSTVKCRDLSGCGILFISPLRPALNTIIQIHIDNLGRFEGVVIRYTEDGFAVHLNASDFIMEQLTDQLASDLEDK